MAEVENTKLMLEHRMKQEMDQLRTAMTFKVRRSRSVIDLTKTALSNMKEKLLAEAFQMSMPVLGNAKCLEVPRLQGRFRLFLRVQKCSIHLSPLRKRPSSGLWSLQLHQVSVHFCGFPQSFFAPDSSYTYL
jgi:hypothetical protein